LCFLYSTLTEEKYSGFESLMFDYKLAFISQVKLEPYHYMQMTQIHNLVKLENNHVSFCSRTIKEIEHDQNTHSH